MVAFGNIKGILGIAALHKALFHPKRVALLNFLQKQN